MAKTESINGSDLMLFIDGTSIALATNHTLQVTMATKDTSTKDNGLGMWSNFEAGLMSWNVSSENLMSVASSNGKSINEVFDLYLQRKPVKVVFGLQSNNQDFTQKLETEWDVPDGGWKPDTANHYEGDALITDFSINAPNGEKATASISLTGCSNLKKIGNGIQKATVAGKGEAVAPVPSNVETAALKK